MTAREQFYQELADGFNLELSGKSREEKRSIIMKMRAKAIPSPSLCSEFIRLAEKQGTLLLSSIWNEAPGRKSRLRHLSMSADLVDCGLFIRVDEVDYTTLEMTGYSKWYISNPAFLQFLPGKQYSSESILAEIYSLRCLIKAGYTVFTSSIGDRKLTFLAVRDDEKLPVIVDAENDRVEIGDKTIQVWNIESELLNLQDCKTNENEIQ